MAVPFLSSITLNKNEVQDFKVFNYAGDVTPLTGTDIGYFWTNTTGGKTLRWWDGAAVRTILDSASTISVADNLSGGAAGSLPYQLTAGDTIFLGIGTADQVLKVNTGATAPEWVNQSSLSVGSATNKPGGALGDILVQSGSGTTTFLNVGTVGQVLTSNGASPAYVNQSSLSVGSATTATTATNVAGGAAGELLYQSGLATTAKLGVGTDGYILTYDGTNTKPKWSASIPAGSVSGLAASATTDTTNAANITSGLLPLARLALATGQFYVGDASNNPAATAKSSISLTGFGALTTDLDIAGFNIINSGNVTSGSSGSTLATKGYVDSVAQGLDIKASCLVASTADINLSAPGSGLIDGIDPVTFTSGTTRILVKDQSLSQQNGIYIWNGTGSAMTRSLDANTWDELVGAFTFIETGTANADSGWVCTANAGGTLGTTPVPFVKFSQAGSYTEGNGMVLSGGAFSFATATPYTPGQIPYASTSSAIGFKSVTGTGDVVLATSPTLVTPALGTPTSGNLSSCTGLSLTTGVSGTLPVANGGTGATTFTAGQVLFGNGTSAINSSSNLFWDNGNSRLGIGTASPNVNAEVSSTDPSVSLRVNTQNAGASASNYSQIQLSDVGAVRSFWRNVRDGAGTVQFAYNSVLQFLSDGGGTPALRATLDSSGNLGLGTVSAGGALEIKRGASLNALIEISGNNNTGGTTSLAVGQLSDNSAVVSNRANASLIFGTNNSGKMFLDASGNLGVGITPSGSYKLQVNGASYLAGVIHMDGNSAIRSLGNGGATYIDLGSGGADGSLVVRSSSAYNTRLTLDSSGNLGLGVTPAIKFHVRSDSASGAVFLRGADPATGVAAAYIQTPVATGYSETPVYGFWYQNIGISSPAANTLGFVTDNVRRMTLDASGNLGIGVAPTSRLTVLGSDATSVARFNAASGRLRFAPYSSYQSTNGVILDSTNTDENAYQPFAIAGSSVFLISDSGNCVLTSDGRFRVSTQGSASTPAFSRTGDIDTGLYFPTDNTLALAVGGSDAVYIDAKRNVGLGMVPSAWSNGYTAIDLKGGASFLTNATIASPIIGANWYINSSDQFIYKANGFASYYQQYNGVHSWHIAPTGTAGNVISGANAFVQAMAIKSTGQLNLTGLAADPTGAAGDLYYSTGNVLKMHNGTAWQQLSRKFSGALSGTGTSFTVTHNLGTRDVTVQVRKSGSTYDLVYTDIQMTDTNTVTVIFASSVTGSDYTVTVIG